MQNSDYTQLIEGCIAQKRDAQHQLFKTFYSKMFGVCYRYAVNYEEAQDMVNEGFMKVFANLDKYKPTGTLESWMKRVVANAALDYQRRHKVGFDTVEYEQVNESQLAGFEENNVLGKLSSDEILELIQKLPAKSKSVFNLYVFENYSHKEIAEIMKIEEGTSHWHLNFARNKLKEMILTNDK